MFFLNFFSHFYKFGTNNEDSKAQEEHSEILFIQALYKHSDLRRAW